MTPCYARKFLHDSCRKKSSGKKKTNKFAFIIGDCEYPHIKLQTTVGLSSIHRIPMENFIACKNGMFEEYSIQVFAQRGLVKPFNSLL